MTDLSTSTSAAASSAGAGDDPSSTETPSPDDSAANETPSPDDSAADEIPIADGEPVRWRRQPGARWNQGTVIGREADGSIAVRDTNSAWRSIPVDRLEAQTVTKRGAKKWVPLADRGPIPVELTAPDPADESDAGSGTTVEEDGEP